MLDDELREQLAAWARPLQRVAPPDISVIRRRARRRTIGLAAGGIGVAAATAAAVVGLLAGHLAPKVTPTSTPSAIAEARYYVTVNVQASSAVVHRTASGRAVATIKPPHGTDFVSVAAARDDRTFVLAAETASAIRFYRLHLSAAGRPEPLEPASVPPLPERAGSCHVQLAGLAVTPDGRTLAISTLSDCANGRAGPSEIETASLASGAVLATFRPGNGYPLSLSWTADGALAYDWSGPQPGVWLIPSAASPGSRPPAAHLLIPGSAGLGGYTGAQDPMITPDGSAVLATLGQGTSLEVAEFSARTGKILRILIPAAADPAQYCGPLWTDPSGRHLLAACGNSAEASIDNGHLTHLPPHWQLPSYPVPGGPQIAW
jgi:hypothetical protein